MKSKIKIIDKKYNKKWIILITLGTLLLSFFFSFISDFATRNLSIYAALATLILIIFIGVIFDIVGVATTVADIKIFNSMAANRITTANYAIKIVRNASKVSNFCSDVIGDIAGILSGAAGTIIVISLVTRYNINKAAILTILMSSIIAALTVGGKAWGKEIALNNSDEIVLLTAKFFQFLDKKLGISILKVIK